MTGMYGQGGGGGVAGGGFDAAAYNIEKGFHQRAAERKNGNIRLYLERIAASIRLLRNAPGGKIAGGKIYRGVKAVKPLLDGLL